MRHYKNYLSSFKISMISTIMLLLSGCMLPLSMQQAHQLKKDCEISSVLLTDLTVSTDQRHYMLPNRQLCPNKSFI